MKKIFKVCICGLAVVSLMAGCSKKDGGEAAPSDAVNSVAMETMAIEDLTNVNNGTVTLGEYKGIEVTRETVEVTEDELNQTIDQDLAAHETRVEVDREVKNGDIVNIDYVGKKDGVAFDGGTAQGYDLTIGSGQFIDGFEDGLLGAEKGDKVSLDLTFPENYQNTELAGQAVVFEVTVNAVQEAEIPELNDAFVQENTTYKTVDEYKEEVRQILLDNKEEIADQNVKSNIFITILEASTVEPDQNAIDSNYNNLVARYTNQAISYGIDFTTFVAAFTGMDEEGFKETLKEQAKAMVEQRLIINAIAENEGIVVTDEDRNEVALSFGYADATALIESEGQFEVDDYVMYNKVLDFLKDNAIIK